MLCTFTLDFCFFATKNKCFTSSWLDILNKNTFMCLLHQMQQDANTQI